jgi:hypothetical protein
MSMVDAVGDEPPSDPEGPVPALLRNVRNPLEPMRRVAHELGGGRAVDNARREIEAIHAALEAVDALARHVPPMAGESATLEPRSA